MNIKKKKLEFQSRIAAITMIVSLLSSLLISFVSLSYLYRTLMMENRRHIRSLAVIAAQSVDGDLLDTIHEGDMYNADFNKIYDQLRPFCTDERVYFVYTMRKVGEDVQFIVDADPKPALLGESFPSYDQIERAFQGEVTLDDRSTEDQWGNYYSAFAPVKNSAGEIVGIVGVDSTVDSVRGSVQSMVVSLLAILIICIIISVILSFISARMMGRFLEEASKDGLTGLFNRRYITKYIKNYPADKEFGFILLDIDCFKSVNDTYGHQTGDEILSALGEILQKMATQKDLCARLGGDEFAVFFGRSMKESEIADLADSLISSFGNVTHRKCPQTPQVGLSMGCVIGEKGAQFVPLVQQADKALYQVKNTGKGRAQIEIFKS